MPRQDRIHAEALPKKHFRTAVGNGVALHGGQVDGRSYNARRFRELHTYFHAGYVNTIPSLGQLALIRRCAALALWCETQEARMANGENVEISEFRATTDQGDDETMAAFLSGPLFLTGFTNEQRATFEQRYVDRFCAELSSRKKVLERALEIHELTFNELLDAQEGLFPPPLVEQIEKAGRVGAEARAAVMALAV